MLKYLVIILLFVSFSGFGQTWQVVRTKPGFEYNGLLVDSIFRAPSDTVHNKFGIAHLNGNLYKGNGTWVKIADTTLTAILTASVNALDLDSAFQASQIASLQSSLLNYLPLTGGTLSGTLNINSNYGLYISSSIEAAVFTGTGTGEGVLIQSWTGDALDIGTIGKGINIISGQHAIDVRDNWNNLNAYINNLGNSYWKGHMLVGDSVDNGVDQFQVKGTINQSSVISAMLKASSTGTLVNAIAGTDYVIPSALSVFLLKTDTTLLNLQARYNLYQPAGAYALKTDTTLLNLQVRLNLYHPLSDSVWSNGSNYNDNIFLSPMYTLDGYPSLVNGGWNISIGDGNMVLNNTGYNNVVLGGWDMIGVTSGNNNAVVGVGGLTNCTTCNNNSVLGSGAGNVMTTGWFNSIVGEEAMFRATTTRYNAAFGNGALLYDIVGGSETALGALALRSALDSFNLGAGFSAGYGLVSGIYNVFLGAQCAKNLTSGTGDIMIGGNLTSIVSTGSNLLNIGGWITGASGIISLPAYTTAGIITNTAAGLLVSTSSPTLSKLNITTGTNANAGQATLVAGTVTVSTTAVTSSSLIFAVGRGATSVYSYAVSTITAGTSFVIKSSNSSDAGVVSWLIIN